jgi:hypothetical protein
VVHEGEVDLATRPPFVDAVRAADDAHASRICSWQEDYYQSPALAQELSGGAPLEWDLLALTPLNSARFDLGNLVPYGPGSNRGLYDACFHLPVCGLPCMTRLGARYDVLPPPLARQLLGRPQFRTLAHQAEPDLYLLEDLEARPLVSFPGVHFVSDESAVADDIAHTAARHAAMVGPGPDLPGVEGGIGFTRPAPDRIEARLHAAAPNIAVVAEQCAAGWTAELDDRPVPLERADLALCALRVPEGEHTLRLRYRPPGWPGAFAPYLLAWLVALVVLGRALGPPARLRESGKR